MLKFILYRHFSNGFVIWSYVLFMLNFASEVTPIALFRTALWHDQIMWAFLIPILFQNWFLVSTKIEIKKIKFHNIKDNFLLPFVIVASVGIIFVSYSLFVWDVFSIISADNNEL